MNKLLRQFSSEEFEALINQMKGGNVFEDLTGPISTSALAVKPDATYSIDKIILTFENILDTMAGSNKILSDRVESSRLNQKEESMETLAITEVQSSSESKRRLEQLKVYGKGILDELKRIVDNSSEGGGGFGGLIRGRIPRITSKGAAIAGIAIGGAAIAVGYGLSQYENFAMGVPSMESLGEDSIQSVNQAIDFFVKKGWSRDQAAGIVGNLMAESGPSINPKAVGDGGRAYGIAQWHPDRQATFERVMGKSIRQSTRQEQLEFVNWELNNTEKAAGAKLRRARSVTEAAVLVDKFYERSAGIHVSKRIQYANQIAQGNENGRGKPMGPMADVVNVVAPGATTISSGYGQRKDPFSGSLKKHNGIDLPGKLNSPVNSIADGIVESAGWKGGYGNTVVIQHDNGKKTLYAHLNYIDKSIKKGVRVSRGSLLGGMGSSGTRSTGTHLHFEVIDNDGSKLNPLQHASGMLPRSIVNSKRGKTKVQPVIVTVKQYRDYGVTRLPPPSQNQKKKVGPARGPTFPSYYQR